MRPLVNLCAAFWLLLPSAAWAHVGSPNVFFEGQAGAWPLRVIIRPPAALPGIAQVDVRVATEGVTNVWLQADLYDSGHEATPAPVAAAPVAGETNVFNGALWLLREGSYSVRVAVDTSQGRETVSIPLNSAATQRPVMSPWLVAALLALGAILFLGAVTLAGAAARDAALEPGAAPGFREWRRARIVTVAAAVLLGAGAYAGKIRWDRMDREFLNNALYKPLPVVTTVRTNGNLRLLHLTPPADDPGGLGWDTLVADHGKLMHLFLMREPDFNAFAHLHPVRRDSRTFENVLPSLPAGAYQLYAEITQENGLSQTLISSVDLGVPMGRAPQLPASNMLNEVFCQSAVAPLGNASQPFALDADDSWHVSSAPAVRTTDPLKQVSPLMGGCKMVFENSADLVENRETSLRFAVFADDGRPVTLQPYMGMLGHAVVRRSGGEVFTHLHPLGTISMAAQELFTRRERSASTVASVAAQSNSIVSAAMSVPASSSGQPAHKVAFPYAFPRPGDYRLWVQVRTSNRVLTGVFDVPVKPAKALRSQ